MYYKDQSGSSPEPPCLTLAQRGIHQSDRGNTEAYLETHPVVLSKRKRLGVETSEAMPHTHTSVQVNSMTQ